MPSIKSRFVLKDEDIKRLNSAILRCGTESEKALNDYLHNVAGEKIAKSITRFLPRSAVNKSNHAKDSVWWEQENYNLAVNISNSLKGKRGTSFYYLYYVATCTGTNKKKGANEFMEKGMEAEHDNIVNGLLDALKEKIDKELK